MMRRVALGLAQKSAVARRSGNISKAVSQLRYNSSKSSEGKSEGKGLGAHFGAGHEHQDSFFLKAFVAAGKAIESVSSKFTDSSIGEVLAPKHAQVHQFGRVEKPLVEVEVVEDESGNPVIRNKTKDQKVEGVPINTEQFAIIPVSEVTDHSPDESAWGLFKALLAQKKYRTTQQQATEELYKLIPDFSEPEFLEDIETKMMPAFLDAFWAKDVDGLKSMCSEACYHLNVESHLKQYEKVESRCRLLMTRRASLFNRLMFIDDSDHAPSVRRRAALAEQGIDLDEMDDLDVDEEKPEPIFFVSCSAHIENEWVDKTGEVKIGGHHEPEDWYFVFGLTPQPGSTWTLSSLEFTKMQAMGAASTASE